MQKYSSLAIHSNLRPNEKISPHPWPAVYEYMNIKYRHTQEYITVTSWWARQCLKSPHECLLNRRRSKLSVTGLWEGNSPGTSEFPAQMASNAESVSIWWRHHNMIIYIYFFCEMLYSSMPKLNGGLCKPLLNYLTTFSSTTASEVVKIMIYSAFIYENFIKWHFHYSVKNDISVILPQDSAFYITAASLWAQWRFKSSTSRLSAQQFVHPHIKENIKAQRHRPSWGESTGDRWIHLTEGQ